MTGREHYTKDFRDSDAPVPEAIETVKVVDGLGREVQTRKTSVVDGDKGMTTTDVVSRDGLGRVVSQFHPFFTEGESLEPVDAAPTFETLITRDVLGRATQTRFPDGSSERNEFAIDTAPNGQRLLHRAHFDRNSNRRDVFTDLAEQTRAVIEHPDAETQMATLYDYTATGELISITDAEGNETTLAYGSFRFFVYGAWP